MFLWWSIRTTAFLMRQHLHINDDDDDDDDQEITRWFKYDRD